MSSMSLFGNEDKGLFGNSGSSGKSILPTFQEKSACDSCCPDLSYKQRIIGFMICASIGYIISFIGTLILFNGFSDANISTFAVLYVIGNIISIISSGFVSGPAAQCKAMWDESHRWVTGFYFLMIIVVFVVCLTKQNIYLIIFLFIVEVLAATWYSISFVPFGRQIVCKFFRSMPCCAPCFAVSDECGEQQKALSSSMNSK